MKLPATDQLLAPRTGRPFLFLAALAAATVVVGGMHLAAPLLTQVLIIAFAVVILSTVYDRLVAWGVPKKAAVALLIVLTAGTCFYVVGWVLSRGIWDLSRKIPAYHSQIVRSAGEFAQWLRAQDVEVPRGLIENFVSFDAATVAAAVRSVAALAGRLSKNVILDIVVIGFLLAELPSLPRAARSVRGMTEERWEVLVRFVRDVRHYMAIKTVISAATGLVVWAGLKILRVDSPELLGFTAFLFNFVPGIGSVMAAIPAVLLALNSGTGTAVWTAVLYLVANQVLGNIIEPRVMGRGFGVSPALVLLSVLFWGWVLGAVGMFFAVPLTLAVRGTLVAASRGESGGAAASAAAPGLSFGGRRGTRTPDGLGVNQEL